jgi:hypothetical protein
MTVGITELPPEGMQLAGVALSGDPDRGTRTTEGLSLLFTTAGITVQGPQPQIERLLVWSGLDSATCGEKIELPDGRDAAVMELTSGGQSIRFLLPAENVTPGQAAYLDQALPAWLARYKVGAVVASPGPGHDGGVPLTGTAPTGGQGAGESAPGVSSAAGNGSVRGTVAAASGASRPPAPSFSGPSSPPAPPSPWSASGPAAAPPAPPSVTGPTSLIPPPPGAPGGAAAGPPPPPPAPAPSPNQAVAPASPDRPDAAAPVKKTKGWRRSRSTPAPPVPPPGALAPSDPPAQPPKHPVPLKLATLPPPANGAPGTATAKGPLIWKPPVDPVTGEAQWDGPLGGPALPPADAPAAPVERRRGLRRWAKDQAPPAAAASAAAAGTVAATGRIDDPPAPSPTAAGPTVDAVPIEAPQPVGTNGAVAPVRPGPEAAPPPTPPTAPSPTPKLSTPDAGRALKRKRTTLVVLVVLLVAVVGGIAYVATNRTTSPKTAVPPVASSPHSVAADTALAASINLRLTDLPATWTNSTAAGQGTRPPVAPANAQVQADQALASCLGVSYPTVAGLFGGAAIPGQTGSATSPTFQSGTDPDIQMYTTTTVLGTAARAQTLAAPFAEPNFVTCFGQYQSSLVSAAVPGSTASIEVVTLAPPAGVKAYGYVTTLTIPAEGTEVIGEGYMIGGRVESKIEPTTNGPTIPTDAFNSAFNAVSGRVAQAQSR